MTQLLDARTSQNASYANSIAIPILAINTPQLFAQQTLDLNAGTEGATYVEFSGTVTFQLPVVPLLTNATITVVRGTLPTDTLVFSATQELNIAIVGPQVISFTGSDFNAPVSEITYTAFVEIDVLGAVRVGPESANFNGYTSA